MKASNADTNIDSSKPIITSIPEQTIVAPPEVHISMSNMEDGRTSNITKILSNKDSHVTTGVGSLTSPLIL